ncbi:MAG: sigma-70 family RNA polymerase sigma factor [Bryobacteraceae bacterium]
MELRAALPLIAREETPARDAASETVELFDELRGPILRYLHCLGLSAGDAEEAMQETFLALFEHLRAGRPRTSLRGWLFRVAHNLGMKQLRRSTTEPLRDDVAASPALDPEQRAEQNQRYRQAAAIVRALSRQDRACLQLRSEGLRYREIAEVLGISLGSVAQSLERALERLEAVRR